MGVGHHMISSEAMKKAIFLSGMNGSKGVEITWKIMEEAIIQKHIYHIKLLKN
jgi:hypothetical protein